MPSGKVFTPEDKDAFVELIGLGVDYDVACDKVGCTRWTIWNHKRKDPVFTENIKMALESVADTLEQTLFRKAREGDAKCLSIALKRLKPAEYTETQRIIHDDRTAQRLAGIAEGEEKKHPAYLTEGKVEDVEADVVEDTKSVDPPTPPIDNTIPSPTFISEKSGSLDESI